MTSSDNPRHFWPAWKSMSIYAVWLDSQHATCSKELNSKLFSAAFRTRPLKHGSKLYLFIPVSLTLTYFQGHWGIGKVKLTVFLWQILKCYILLASFDLIEFQLCMAVLTLVSFMDKIKCFLWLWHEIYMFREIYLLMNCL